MAKLKCPNCEKIIDKKALAKYTSVGATHADMGVEHGLLLWPFTLCVYAECPNCRQEGWLKVLSPWSKG